MTSHSEESLPRQSEIEFFDGDDIEEQVHIHVPTGSPQRSRPNTSLTVNVELAEVILDQLYLAWMGSRQLFEFVDIRKNAPQHLYQPQGLDPRSLEGRIYQSIVTMTDRWGTSDVIYQGHLRLFKAYPWLYREQAVTADPRMLERIVKEYQTGIAAASARNWPVNMGTFFNVFDGDPLRIYASGNIDTILRFRKESATRDQWKLPGFGPKILSLLAMFFAELELIEIPENTFPIDRHAQRFALSTGIVSGNGIILSETLERIIRPLFYQIAIRNNWSIVELSHAIWFLGNKLCGKCPISSGIQDLCPVYEHCGGAISAQGYNRGFWDLDKDRFPKGKGGEKHFRLLLETTS